MSHLNLIIKSQPIFPPDELIAYPSDSCKIDVGKKVKSRRIIRENSQKYHWKRMENKRYIKFVMAMRSLFDLSTEEKRYIGINKMMSDYIRTRDSIQCHTHHQKIIKKYGSIDDAVKQMAVVYCSKRKRQGRRSKLTVKIQEAQQSHYRGKHFQQSLSNEKESTKIANPEDPTVKLEQE